MKHSIRDNRVGEIELFRAIFCLIIMIYHGKNMVGTENILFRNGAFCVEFFFLVSGYLMMATVVKRSWDGYTPTCKLSDETLRFISKKIGGFFPEMLVAYIIGFTVTCIAKGLDLAGILQLFLKNPFEVLLIQITSVASINVATWYLQSMILCMMILYPLLRKFPDMMAKIVCPLVGILLIGWLCCNHDNLRSPHTWLGFTFKGNVRAMAELCLGCTSYFVVQWLKSFQLTRKYRIVVTAVKWCCWAIILAYLHLKGSKYDAFFLLIMLHAVSLSFSQQGIDADLYQNRVIFWLGKMSLPFFLSHYFFPRTLLLLLPEDVSHRTLWAAYFLCTFMTTAVVHWGGKGIRRVAAAVKNDFLQMKMTDHVSA